jgi:acyl-CoA thioesterase
LTSKVIGRRAASSDTAPPEFFIRRRMPTTGLFDIDTTVTPIGVGRYSATLSEHWNALGATPNGGYSLALTLNALAQQMRPLGLPDPLTVSSFFLRRAATGAAEVRTALARVGKRTASGEAQLWQGGDEIVRTVAVFTDLGQARGRTLALTEPPALPPPEQCVELSGGRRLPGVTIADRIEIRCPERPGWTLGRPSGDPRALFWMRYTDGREPDTLALPSLVDACAPVVMELGARGSSTIELTTHVRARPAPGWLACRVVTRHVIAGYHDEDFEIWDSSGQLVAQSRQLALMPQDDG